MSLSGPVQALGERKKSINGARILIIGIAYKKDVDDMRESPSLKLIELLLQQGRRWIITIRISR